MRDRIAQPWTERAGVAFLGQEPCHALPLPCNVFIGVCEHSQLLTDPALGTARVQYVLDNAEQLPAGWCMEQVKKINDCASRNQCFAQIMVRNAAIQLPQFVGKRLRKKQTLGALLDIT